VDIDLGAQRLLRARGLGRNICTPMHQTRKGSARSSRTTCKNTRPVVLTCTQSGHPRSRTFLCLQNFFTVFKQARRGSSDGVSEDLSTPLPWPSAMWYAAHLPDAIADLREIASGQRRPSGRTGEPTRVHPSRMTQKTREIEGCLGSRAGPGLKALHTLSYSGSSTSRIASTLSSILWFSITIF